MKVENRSSQTFEVKTVHDGNLKIRVENDGTVSIDGYLYRADGNEGNNQMEYLQDAAKLLPEMIKDIQKGGKLKPQKKVIWKAVLQEVGRLFVFGGLGVVISQTIIHNLIIGLIAALLAFIGAFFYRPIKW